MRTLGRLWWHTILALMIAGGLGFVGAIIATIAPSNWIEGIGILLFVAAVIVGAPGAFIALEVRHHYQRKQADASHVTRATHTHARVSGQ